MDEHTYVRPTHRRAPPVIVTGGRRPRRLYLLILVLLLAVVLFGRLTVSYYVNALWFASLGYVDVFWKTLIAQWLVFVIFTVATFLILYLSFLALKRSHSSDFPGPRTILIAGQTVNVPVDRILRVLTLGFTLVVAVVSGAVMTANWATLALYWYAPSSSGGMVDPIFGKALGFYLFSLPAWQLISGWLMSLAVIVCIAAIFFFIISGGLRVLRGPSESSFAPRWRGLSITFAFLLLFIALRVYLGRFEQLFESHTIFTGVTYTDAHIILPGQLFLCAALILGAGIAASNAFWAPQGRRLLAAIVPALLCYLVVQIFGWYVNGFVVKPNELVREQPYISHNIQFTRQAFGLDRITSRPFPGDAGIDAINAANNRATL